MVIWSLQVAIRGTVSLTEPPRVSWRVFYL
ncbi:Uncharacterised protein [Escherichia coli]|nr:Uncharacterised protein [Escherichia coli]CTT16915.1 Uncharacterised protein [Escherichia coli]CTT22853.1 Uncharacterised protein [Escherichia coli]CTT25100.1 Uncharacterised protein [Escherichia coli]CTW46576.1 Uncharacterised protein [Escherichia coli]